MKKLLLSLVVCGSVMGLAASANADERVATDELPAALLAIGGGSQDLLTTSEADEVRGEGLLLGLGAKANVKVRANVGAHVNVLGLAHVNAKVKAKVHVKARGRLGIGLH